MGIRKTYIKYTFLIVLPLIIFSCGDKAKTPSGLEKTNGTKAINELIRKNEKLKDHIKFQDETFNSWLNTFSEIQEEFLSIDTDDLYHSKNISNEGFAYKQDYILELKTKAAHIQQLLDQKDKELSQYATNYHSLKKVLSSYRSKLEYANNRINSLDHENKALEIENKTLFNKNEKLNIDLEVEKENIKALEGDLKVANLKLEERYVIQIANRESKISKINSLPINLDYNLNKYELLTSHPPGSYSLSEIENKAVLFINRKHDFWAHSQFLVLKVKKRKLN